jgi:tRNA(fMet)-specific endonuclease VapC
MVIDTGIFIEFLRKKDKSEIYHNLRRRNLIIEFRDIFIGATAITFQLPIKTLNQDHFQRIEFLDLI